MRLFWELIRLSFRLQLTYRAANLAGLATNFFFGLLGHPGFFYLPD